MDYKLIALDMDGTLLNGELQLSNRTKDAINAVNKKGVNVVLSTGRMLSSAQVYARELELDNYIIASNGAVIMDDSKNIIYSKNINLDKLEVIMDIGKFYDVYYHFYDSNTLYTDNYVKEIVDFYNNRDSRIDYKVIRDTKEIYEIDNLKAYKFIFFKIYFICNSVLMCIRIFFSVNNKIITIIKCRIADWFNVFRNNNLT